MAQPWEGGGYNFGHHNPSSSHAFGGGPFFSLWEKSAILIDSARQAPMFAAAEPGFRARMIRAG
jgi:hypothetical protein